MLQPAVTLTWNDSFPEASPFQYQLTYNGTKLSGVSQDINTTLMLSSDDVTAMTGDNLYIVTELLFYTEYTFTLVADYNLTGQVFQSVGVVESLTTREGRKLDNSVVEMTFIVADFSGCCCFIDDIVALFLLQHHPLLRM